MHLFTATEPPQYSAEPECLNLHREGARVACDCPECAPDGTYCVECGDVVWPDERHFTDCPETRGEES